MDDSVRLTVRYTASERRWIKWHRSRALAWWLGTPVALFAAMALASRQPVALGVVLGSVFMMGLLIPTFMGRRFPTSVEWRLGSEGVSYSAEGVTVLLRPYAITRVEEVRLGLAIHYLGTVSLVPDRELPAGSSIQDLATIVEGFRRGTSASGTG